MSLLSRGKEILDGLLSERGQAGDDPLALYNRARSVADTALPCHAPFNSMYFNVHGEVGPCWLNLNGYGRYPELGLRDIWFGSRFSALRSALSVRDLSYSCGTCLKNIRSGNHVSVLARIHDQPYPLGDYPSVMEFELSNRCNLECVMCKGELSSTIRKNREGLPPMSSHYDSDFVHQLEEFMPHLREAKFLGGEPFLIDIYYEIWQRMAELNPHIRPTVTTNATVLNNRVKDVLGRMRFNIIVSIDSFDEDTYAAIRHRGELDKVMPNFLWFRKYAEKCGTYFQVSVNPLRKNWHDLPRTLETCNRHNAHLWFNTVTYPHSEALWTMGHEELAKVEQHLLAAIPDQGPDGCEKQVFDNNLMNYRNLVENQVRVWRVEAEQRYQEQAIVADSADTGRVGSELIVLLRRHIEADAYLTAQMRDRLQRRASERVNAMLATKDEEGLRALLRMPMQQALDRLLTDKGVAA
jgi:MoaA/NifB/PqqE/SkfB family radical SAM enzyme